MNGLELRLGRSRCPVPGASAFPAHQWGFAHLLALPAFITPPMVPCVSQDDRGLSELILTLASST